MDEEQQSHLTSKQTWLRGLYMLLFVVIYHVAEFVIGAVVVLQFLFSLFTGQVNARLLQFGHSLSRYAYQILRYLTFNSEQLPFPFDDWPSDDSAQE
jgi:hypothetical protein